MNHQTQCNTYRRNMKAFIVLVAVAISVQALTEEQKEKIKQYHKDCAAESGVDEEVVAKARKGDFTDDIKFKKHLLCFSKKAGFQNEAGDLQIEVLRTKLNAELKDLDVTNKLLEKCAVKQKTPEDTAYETTKCCYENNPKKISIA